MLNLQFNHPSITTQNRQDGISLNHHKPYSGSTTGELHTHDYYELAYTYTGEGVHIINDAPYTVKKGTVIIMKPGDYHSYYSLTDMYIIHCNFIKNDLIRYLPNNATFPLVIHLNEYYQLQIEMLLHLLETESKSDEPEHYRAVHEFLDLILFTINRVVGEQTTPSTMSDVLSYILSDIKNADFSEAVKIFRSSEAHFCRVFKREFSTTFKQYVTKLRIQKAKDLLLNTKKSISEIYEEVGYNNNRTFFVDFKKSTDMTPSQYRKVYKDNKNIEKDLSRLQSF